MASKYAVLLLGVVAMAPLRADIILAPNSLTAFGIADDGVGDPAGPVTNPLPPGPVQIVNLNDGPNARARAVARYGFLRAGSRSRARSSAGVPSLVSGNASADWQDNLLFESATLDGTIGMARGSFRIDGALTSEIESGVDPLGPLGALALSRFLFETYDRVVIAGGEVAVPTSELSGFYLVGLDGYSEGTNFLGSIIDVEFPFVYGQPVVFRYVLSVGTVAQSQGYADGVRLRAEADLTRSVEWLGLSVQDAPPDLLILAESGTDWSAAAAVAEPADTLALAAGGLGFVLLVLLSGRGRRCGPC